MIAGTVARVAERVAAMVRGLTLVTAEAMVARASGPRSVAALEDHLAGRPDALCAGDAGAPALVLHLVHLLAAAGFDGVVPLACTSCGRGNTRLIRHGPTGRICDMCWLKAHERECDRCPASDGRPAPT